MKYITNLFKYIKDNQKDDAFLFDTVVQYIFSLENNAQSEALIKFLEQKWQPSQKMQRLLEGIHITDSNERFQLIVGWIDNSLKLLFSKGGNQKTFYAGLLDILQSAKMEDRGYILAAMYSNILIPYRKIKPGISMDDKQFGDISAAIFSSIQYGYQVIYSNFRQRTEVSSLLMKEADKLGEKDRIVFWAVMFSAIEERSDWVNKIQSRQGEENKKE